ncbi:MAG: NepR family anti-sigma factor [Xanthobacteraceae bacterium]
MNEHKSVRPESVGQKPIQPETPGAKALRSEATMHTDAHVRKAGGRLSREDQRRLGDILQRVYDDVIHQGVPDRFKELLTELEEPRDKVGGAEKAAASGQLEGRPSPDSDRLLAAKGSDNKGSHS